MSEGPSAATPDATAQPAAAPRARRHLTLPHRPRVKPTRYRDLPAGALRRIAVRTFNHYRSDGVSNLAAALTYRTVLSTFPGLIALIALLGVLGQYPETFNAVLRIVSRFAPQTTVNTIASPVRTVITHRTRAGTLLGAGFLVSIWAASGYMGTLAWSSNVIWEARRGRSWYRQWPLNLAITAIAVSILTLVLSALVLTGPVARSVGKEIGIGSTALSVWSVAKWPAIVIVMTLMISALYHIIPNVRPPSWRWLTPGALLAMAAFAVTTAAFGFYIAHFGDYSNTYGALSTIVTFLVWVWLTNIGMLLGVELNSEIERERQIAAGADPEGKIVLPLRQS